MDNKIIQQIAEESRTYVKAKIVPIFKQEPLLYVQPRDYEFRVKFPGKHEVHRSVLIPQVINQLNDNKKISIYAHIPQCEYRCNFCTYAVTLSGDADEDAYRLLKERDALHKLIPLNIAKTSSLYFGGGTPTTLSSDGISNLVRGFVSQLQITSETEITMEGSPDTINEEKLYAAKEAGVTRFSVGVQTFNEEILNICNRKHTTKEAENAIELLSKAGFQEFNVDLMRGLPNQTLEGFIDDLLHAVNYNPTTIHVYRMRVMRKSELHSVFENSLEQLVLPTVEEVCAMQYAANKILTDKGYQQHHTASWSKTQTKVFEDRWQQQIPLIALGWRAYSLFQFGEWHNSKQLGTWRSQVDSGEVPIETAWKYNPLEQELRHLLFQLKMSSGVKVQYIESLNKPYISKFKRLVDLGIVKNQDGSFTLKDEGVIVGEEAIKYLSLEH